MLVLVTFCMEDIYIHNIFEPRRYFSVQNKSALDKIWVKLTGDE